MKLNKNFRIWFEAVINRDKARALVLNAIDVSDEDVQARNDVMGVQLKAYPNLAEKIAAYPELQSHQSEITGWIRANPKKTIQQLIEYLKNIDALESPNVQPQTTPTPTPPIGQPPQVAPPPVA